jgi:hypothetical protein
MTATEENQALLAELKALVEQTCTLNGYVDMSSAQRTKERKTRCLEIIAALSA